MRFLTPILLGTVLIGAASSCDAMTINKLRVLKPDIASDSLHSVTEISSCITSGWSNRDIELAFLPRPDGGDFVVGGSSPILLVEIRDRGRQRHVEAHYRGSIWAGQNRHHLDQIRGCL